MATTGSTTGTTQLQYLKPVQDVAAKTATQLQSGYTTGRKYVPGAAEPYVRGTEELAAQYGAPVLTAAQDQGAKVLGYVDSTIASTVQTASTVHHEGYKKFSQARDDTFKWVEHTFDYFRRLLNPFPYINAVVDPIKGQVRKTLVATDVDGAVDYLAGVANKIGSIGPVPKVLSIAEPYGKKAYDLSQSVVKTPIYKQAVDTAWGVYGKAFSFASSTWAYKKGAEYIWPQVAFVAEPVIDKVQTSKYANNLYNFAKPKTA